MTLDLFETNAGGLILLDRDALAGWFGFERGQNLRNMLVSGRADFTLASDAPQFDYLGDGSLYEPIESDVADQLYADEGRTNAAVRVATWEDGKVTVYSDRSVGASAKWYLDTLAAE